MGRTLRTANQIILDEQEAFNKFKYALPRQDRRLFDKVFALARNHTAAISQANFALPFQAVLLAMLFEQLKEIEQLNRLVETVQEQTQD